VSLRLGYFYGIGAYVCWGAFPLFFSLLAAVSPYEIVPWRVITALLFCVIAVTATRGWGSTAAILRSPKTLGWFALSTALLYANWQFDVVGIVSGRIIETALGYFINPIVTILIGVFVRKESLSRLQWTAVSIATIGVLVSAIAYGRFPFIALGLALSFGLYGAVRKHAGDDVDSLTGLTIETLLGTVIAVLQLCLILLVFGRLEAFDHGPAVTIPLLLSGVATAIPLLFFGAGIRRLPLSQMGFIQFITPILGFLTGYFVFHEEMSAARWLGFCAVWLALAVLIVDMVRAIRRARALGVEPDPKTEDIVIQHGA